MIHGTQPVRNILVVDNHRPETNRLACEFPADKYTVSVANDEGEALFMMGTRNYDAAIIDMDLPRFVSFDLLRRMRKEHPSTKVIMMTDLGDEELWVDVLSEGATDLLAKPILRRDIERNLGH